MLQMRTAAGDSAAAPAGEYRLLLRHGVLELGREVGEQAR